MSNNVTNSELSGRIAYSGIEGSFASIAVGRLFPEAEKRACHSFREAYEKVVDGSCDAAVLPIENSYAGEVGQVSDLMFAGDLVVAGVYELAISQCLLGVPGATEETIRTVISHPQALEQCAEYVAQRDMTTIPFENTARAAREVSRRGDPTVGAIASAETAELYGLSILDRDINESAHNTTRFAVFVRKDREAPVRDQVRHGSEKTTELEGALRDEKTAENTILLFTLKHVAGALARAVSIIGLHDFNMRVIRSRPVKDVNWQYYFYTELEGSLDTEDGRAMLMVLGSACELIKVVGTYRPDARI